MTRRRSRRPRSVWFRRLGWFAAIVFLLSIPATWFAPGIVASSDLRQRILPLVLPDFVGSFDVGSARLGWFSPVELHNVTATDTAGQPLLTAATIRTENNLLSLLTARHQVGMVHVEKPHLTVQFDESTSNVETAIAPLLKADPNAKPVSLTLVIQEGTAEIDDTFANTKSQLGQVNATITTPRVDRPLRVQAGGQLVTQEQAGTFDADFILADGANQSDSKLLLETKGLPVTAFSAALRRALPEAEFTGELTCDVGVTLNQTGDTGQLEGTIATPELRLAAPTLLGEDAFSLIQAHYEGKTTFDTQQLSFEKVTFKSSVGNMNATGSLPLANLRHTNWKNIALDVAASDLAAAGEVDLAALAEMLPGVLRIRDGVTVTRGSVNFGVGHSPEAQTSTRLAHVVLSNLQALDGQRLVSWTQPIQLRLVANTAGGEPQVESLVCRSHHLMANVTQRDGGFDINAQADLNGLFAQLNQVIDLGQIQMAGSASARAFVTRNDQQQLAASGAVTLERFLVRIPGYLPWQEQRLTATGEASGAWPTDQPPTIKAAQLQLSSGQDVMVAELLQPVTFETWATTSWPAQVEVRGDLSRWQARLAPVLPAHQWFAAGTVNAAAKGMFSPRFVSISSSDVKLANLNLRQIDPRNAEVIKQQYVYPQAELQTAGSWDVNQRRGQTSVLALATPAWSVRGTDLAMQVVDQGLPQVAGEFAFRSDLARTMATLRTQPRPDAVDLQGTAVGTLNLRHAQGITSASWDAVVDNFAATGPGDAAAELAADPQRVAIGSRRKTLWQEPRMTLAGQATYAHESDKLSLAQCDVAGDAASVKMIGLFTDITTAPQVDLSGTTTYDLAALTPRLQPWLGSEVQLAGERSGTFALKGPLPQWSGKPKADDQLATVRVISSVEKVNELTPLVSPELTGSATGGWTTASAYGVALGEANLAAELKESIIRVQPINLAIGQGRLRAAPWVYLDRTPGIIALQEGPLLENVDLTREMCHSWLKYVAPLMADATRCQGKISANVTQAQMPLGSPEQMTASGTLTIHGGQVVTGPLADQYIAVARQIQSLVKGELGAGRQGEVSLVSLPQQTVDVQVSEGKVHHRGLTMLVGDVKIQTAGNVGLDQTLDLMATVVIDPSWVAGKPVVAALAGQTIQIPISGSVGRPSVDGSGLQGLSRQLLRGAAGNLLQGEVNKLFEGLLPGG